MFWTITGSPTWLTIALTFRAIFFPASQSFRFGAHTCAGWDAGSGGCLQRCHPIIPLFTEWRTYLQGCHCSCLTCRRDPLLSHQHGRILHMSFLSYNTLYAAYAWFPHLSQTSLLHHYCWTWRTSIAPATGTAKAAAVHADSLFVTGPHRFLDPL